MNIKDLTFGIGNILRERVDGWAETDGGTPHVYPDHPPLDLAKSSYPRATVDTIGYGEKEEDIDKEAIAGDVLVDITVYAVNSGEIVELLGDSMQALIDYQDENDLDGDPYLEDFSLIRFGIIAPVIEEQTDRGFTRYNKTQETEFEGITTKTV